MEHTADDVAEVRDVVNVRQGAGDENVPLSGDRELRSRRIPSGASHLEQQMQANSDEMRKKEALAKT